MLARCVLSLAACCARSDGLTLVPCGMVYLRQLAQSADQSTSAWAHTYDWHPLECYPIGALQRMSSYMLHMLLSFMQELLLAALICSCVAEHFVKHFNA